LRILAFYFDHRTVDGKLGIITDTFATPGNVHTRSSISVGSTGSAPASGSTRKRSASTRATP
jgi:hypothetical protein